MSNPFYSTGWRRAILTNTETSATLTIDPIMVENSSLDHEVISVDTARSRIFGGERYVLNISFQDDAAYSTLRTWEELYQPITLRIETGGSVIHFDTETTLEVVKMPKADKRNGLNIYTMKTEITSDKIFVNEAWQGIGIMQISTTFEVG